MQVINDRIFIFGWTIPLRLNHRCHMDCFTLVLTTFLNVVVALLSMQGQKALGFHLKYVNLCFEDEWRSSGFETKWGWVSNDRILILGWTNPLTYKNIVFALASKITETVFLPTSYIHQKKSFAPEGEKKFLRTAQKFCRRMQKHWQIIFPPTQFWIWFWTHFHVLN